MNETYNTDAIVLNRIRFKEKDAKVYLFSKNKGMLELVCRGTAKADSKLAPHIEPFNHINLMVVRGKHYDYVGSAISENVFQELKSDYEKIEAAGFAIRVFLKAVELDQADDDLYYLLYSFLENLNNTTKLKIGYTALTYFFILKLLAELGYRPELYYCVKSNIKIDKNQHYFDFAGGGLVNNAKKNDANILISEDSIKILRLTINENFGNLTKLNLNKNQENEIINVISSFYNYHFN